MTDYYAQVHGHLPSGNPWSFGWRITSNQTPASLMTTWSNAWINAWTNGTYGLQTIYSTLIGIDYFTVAPLNGTMHEVTKEILASPQPGVGTDNPLPERTAIVASLRSPSIQKFGRGRTYLPAPSESFLVAGLFTSASMTRVKTALQAVQTAIQADGSTIFVTNLKPLKDGTPPYRKTVITNLLVARKPGTQERRTDPTPSNYV